MAIEIRVPALPESVSDATVLTWHKQPGQQVSRDEPLLDLETDKVVLEVPAPTDGVLSEIRQGEGALVRADEVLGILAEGGQAAAAEATPAAQPAAAPEAKAETPAQAAPTAEPAPVLTPAVRRLVKELALDAGEIQGSGKQGRIQKADVMRYLDERDKGRDPDIAAESAGGHRRNERRVPMSRIRARIAERLVQAQQNAAMLTTFNEVNLQRVTELRNQYRDEFERVHGVRLGFMSFFVRAAVEALKQFPVLNASIDGNDILYHDYFDIGIAVSSPRGLVVPVLRDTDRMSLAEIETGIKSFGQRAKDGNLSYEDLQGGTFSITNGGVFGSMLSTPILNPPQSAILGMHSIQDRPVAEQGQVVIRPMMYLALTYDHRLVDGREAVQFLVRIKQCLEDPARLLLEV